jgi:hypothetical protein
MWEGDGEGLGGWQMRAEQGGRGNEGGGSKLLRQSMGVVMKSSLLWSLLAILLGSGVAAADTPNDPAKLDAWHKSMARVPLPKKGCFTVNYPSTQWQEVPCGKPPARSYGPSKLYLVGHGINFEAVTANSMSSATGSFDSVNVASETDNGTPDIYSLQLNSGFFSAPAACSGGSSNCQGWQQFIYSSGLQTAFIEYWLLHYMAPCPPGWIQSGSSCVMNSVMLPVGPQPISNLQNMTLQGTAMPGGGDTITVATPATISAMYQDNVLDLANDWKKVEFGLFGDGGGDEATFLPDPGSTMAVRTTVDDGTMNIPTCALEHHRRDEQPQSDPALLRVWRREAGDRLLAEQQSERDVDVRQRHEHRRHAPDEFQQRLLRLPGVG